MRNATRSHGISDRKRATADRKRSDLDQLDPCDFWWSMSLLPV